jgi:hypothetical protein
MKKILLFVLLAAFAAPTAAHAVCAPWTTCDQNNQGNDNDPGNEDQ